MNDPKPISDPAVRVLSWLLDLAVQRAGYTVRVVPGWATAEQIETGVKSWGTAELMRAEARRGRVLQHDARPPGDSRPSWLYRISQPGVDQLAAALDIVPPRIRPPLDPDERGAAGSTRSRGAPAPGLGGRRGGMALVARADVRDGERG